MLFNTFVFAGLFLPLTLLLFWLVPSPRIKRLILLVSSLIFYSYWLPSYLVLLLCLVMIAWYCGVLASNTQSAWPIWLASTLLLGTLAYYKYAGFFLTVANDLDLINDEAHYFNDISLPLGISFIVFQALGYVVDVSRREFPVEKRFTVALLFKGFFPQLIAGPICRAHELIPQLIGNFRFRLNQFTSGLAIFAIGLFLKEFFADGLAPLVDQLYEIKTNYTFMSAWASSIGFGGQIYADFWGYSTMAVGLARMFGIYVPVNFRLPYLATSLRKFWRCWHITLSQWLRDYLYKPLGGSKFGGCRTILALMLTMLLGGLWHGANYTFILWGGLHGAALTFEHLIRNRSFKIRSNWFMFVSTILGWLYCIIIVFVSWIIFRANDIAQAFSIINALFSFTVITDSSMVIITKQISFLFFTLMVLKMPIEWILNKLRHESIPVEVTICIAFWAILGAVVLGSPASIPFIYFQF